jgi:hypothetical protein
LEVDERLIKYFKGLTLKTQAAMETKARKTQNYVTPWAGVLGYPSGS